MKRFPFLRAAWLAVLLLAWSSAGRAADWQLLPFVKVDAVNPILTPRAESEFNCPLHGRVKWEEAHVFNPAAVVRAGKVWLLYNGVNAKTNGDPRLPAGNFASGQLLFDPRDPGRMLARSDDFFSPPTARLRSPARLATFVSSKGWCNSRAPGSSTTAPPIPWSPWRREGRAPRSPDSRAGRSKARFGHGRDA